MKTIYAPPLPQSVVSLFAVTIAVLLTPLGAAPINAQQASGTGDYNRLLRIEPQIKPAASPRPFQDDQVQEKPFEVPLDQVLKLSNLSEIKVTPIIGSDDKRPADKFSDYLAKYPAKPAVARPPRLVMWEAANIRYQPLYFEDVILERYGQTSGPLRQPWVSGYRFVLAGSVLPYNAWIERPRSCDSPLGYVRPGRCTIDQRQRIITRR